MTDPRRTPATAPPERFNFAAYLLALNAGRAGKPAYFDDAGITRYGDLAERVCRVAAGLSALGVRRSRNVAMVATFSRT